MTEINTNQEPNNDSDKKDDKAKSPQEKARETMTRRQKVVVFGSIGTIIFTVAGITYFVTHTDALVSIILFPVATIFVAVALYYELRNLQTTKIKSAVWAVVLVLVCILLYVHPFWSITHPDPIPEPESKKFPLRITVTLNTSHAPDDLLLLTNKELIATQYESTGTNTPLLIIPFSKSEKFVEMQLLVKNDTHIALDDFTVSVLVPKGLNIDIPISDKGLMFDKRRLTSTEYFSLLITCENIRPLLTGNTLNCPFRIDTSSGISSGLAFSDHMQIEFRAKDSDILAYVFVLVIVKIPDAITTPQKPRLINRRELFNSWPGIEGIPWN